METKVCTKCGKELPITEFHWRNKSKGTHRSECKACHNAYMYNKNLVNREAINAIKAQCQCVKCGDTRSYVLDYHHVTPAKKVAAISRLMVHSSLDKTLEEIEKCVPLCANCHREFHYLEKEQGITLADYLT